MLLLTRLALFAFTILAMRALALGFLAALLLAALHATHGLRIFKVVVLTFLALVMCANLVAFWLSRTSAMRFLNAQAANPADETQRWLLATVERLSKAAGIATPAVFLYFGTANAFSIGAGRDNAFIAVSTPLLEGLQRDEIEAVIAHEITHISNGDMATLALVRAAMGTANDTGGTTSHTGWAGGPVVISSSARMLYPMPQALYYTVSRWAWLRGLPYFPAVLLMMYLSRRREFTADRGAAQLTGSTGPMIRALRALEQLQPEGSLPPSLAPFGICNKSAGEPALFRSHPSLQERIAALEDPAWLSSR